MFSLWEIKLQNIDLKYIFDYNIFLFYEQLNHIKRIMLVNNNNIMN